jgi:7-dehydrocholesterol reductase
VHLPETLNFITAFLIFVIGAAAILGNFWCDYQRMIYREEYQKTKKLSSVGYIEAISKQGEDRGNKYPLITTGLWGISRNFRYVLELLGTFFWTLPASFFLPLPWFYFLFLTILLVDRANRNDSRCHHRYKEDWILYCQNVPYKIIPWIY